MLAIGHEPEMAEVDLAFDRRVVHPHRRLVSASTTALDGKAHQGAVRHIDAAALKQYPDLDDGEAVVHPLDDPVLLGEQNPPRVSVVVGPVRANPFHHLVDQLVGELLLATAAVKAELDRSGDVAPCCLAVDADPVGDRVLTFTFQPATKRLFDLDHR